MKFVWTGGAVATADPWTWWQLFRYNWCQRRAERKQAAERALTGVDFPTRWWR